MRQLQVPFVIRTKLQMKFLNLVVSFTDSIIMRTDSEVLTNTFLLILSGLKGTVCKSQWKANICRTVQPEMTIRDAVCATCVVNG